MASITKLKGKRGVRFQYSLQVNGRQERRVFATKEEAEAALQDRQREIREGRIQGVTPKPLEEAVEEYLSYKAGKGKRTVAKDRERLTAMLAFFGRETKTTDLTAARIAQYERARATAPGHLGRPVKPATINRALSILRCAMRLWRAWGYVREVPRFELAREERGRLRYLEREEAARLLDACRRSQNPYLYAIVTCALYTGMRKGEILGLTWDRVDFARGALVLVQTKSGEPRDLPMAEAVYTVLADLRQRQVRAGQLPVGLVFRRADGRAWGAITTAFAVALRKAGITGFRFHDLRHTFASWLVMDGVPLAAVKELLGHASLTMTMRYAHLSPARLRDAVGRLDHLFGSSGSGLSGISAAISNPASAASVR